MKTKLLALMLVLGMASMADATLSLVVGDGTTFVDPGDEIIIGIGETIWIGINDSVGVMYEARISCSMYPFNDEWTWTGNKGVYSPPAISTALGWTYWEDPLFPGYTVWDVDLSDPESTETPLPGVGCAVEFRGLDEGNVEIFLNEAPMGADDYFTLHIVPEPATLFLLGLGGLTLLRKRRVKR